MGLVEIFENIVKIMHEDYAGCIDKKGKDNPARYRESIKGDMDINEFYSLVKEYLLAFEDRHIFLKRKNGMEYGCGFQLRRYKDKLYVINSNGRCNLKIGDVIIKIDGLDIIEAEKKYSAYLMGETNERQDWQEIINKSKSCLVKRGKELFSYNIRKILNEERKVEYSYYCKTKDVGVMTLSDFNNEEAVKKMLRDNKENLESKKYLIIDVRKNAGGTDTAYFSLLKYIFNKRIMLSELLENQSMSVNYTEHNCRNRIEMYKKFLSENIDNETRKLIQEAIDEAEKNMGKGFVLEESDFDYEIKGKEYPLKVIVLTDCYCGSSGDSFVNVCKKSEKVTVIGRNTLGVTDYSNLAIVDYGEFQLYYPTSRDNAIDEGKGINGIGVQVDHYIPWTDKFLKKDMDMYYALKLIENYQLKV